jgi:sulfite exporter TauE/SafE
MEATIVASAFMLGLAGAPHCTAMCAAPCAAVVGRGEGAAGTVAFHAARIAGYAGAGAVAAGGLAMLGALSQVAPVLRPLWALVHAGLFVLGLWLLWQGRQPALLAQWGRPAQPTLALAGWQPVSAPARPSMPSRKGAGQALQAGVAGGLWFAWPCGLLQSALLVAALSNSALGGAVAMAAFAAASAAGLVLAPLVWRRLDRAGTGRAETWALRAAGLLMAAMSGWALTEGLWHRFAEYCATL